MRRIFTELTEPITCFDWMQTKTKANLFSEITPRVGASFSYHVKSYCVSNIRIEATVFSFHRNGLAVDDRI